MGQYQNPEAMATTEIKGLENHRNNSKNKSKSSSMAKHPPAELFQSLPGSLPQPETSFTVSKLIRRITIHDDMHVARTESLETFKFLVDARVKQLLTGLQFVTNANRQMGICQNLL